MTAYICDTPWRGFHYLWADTSDEAQGLVWAIAGDPAQARVAEFNAWEAYRVTSTQLAAAVAFGVVLTDRYGPAEWLARRDGDTRRLEILLAARDKRAPA